MNYYNAKLFRHSDIYGVYPYFKNRSEYAFSPNDDNGTPFGEIIISKELKYEDKIDILYKLKLKKSIVIISAIFLMIFPILYIILRFTAFQKIIKNKYLLLLLFINALLYYLTFFTLKKFSIITLKYSLADIILSYIFLLIAFNILNKKILPTLLFEAISIFSFFVIEPLGLTFQNRIILFKDIPELYPSLIEILPYYLKVITVIATIIYFFIMASLIVSSIYNLIKTKKSKAIIIVASVSIFIFVVFFRKTNIEIWAVDFKSFASRNGIIKAINYRINYDRMNNGKNSKNEVLNSVNLLKEKEKNRDYSDLLLNSSVNRKRDVFLIFLESFYDYSHFIELFDMDPFPKEYRDWANNSRKIHPNSGGGSFYARLSGLTAASPLYPKTQSKKIIGTLPYLLSQNGYYTLALEEAESTYNLNNFLPVIGFQETIFGIGNINSYLEKNISNLSKPMFVYGFTFFGHTGSHLENSLNIKENNVNFFNFIDKNDTEVLIETMDNSVMTAMQILKIKNTILKYSDDALIIFKHDHLYPYLSPIIERSSIDEKIKSVFLNDYTPSPILIWDGTNGAYKAPKDFTSENIPMFIAVNAGVTNYRNSVISLLYKEQIGDIIGSYNAYYRLTNEAFIPEYDIQTNSEIFKYENAQRILSQDIFQGNKYYFDIMNYE